MRLVPAKDAPVCLGPVPMQTVDLVTGNPLFHPIQVATAWIHPQRTENMVAGREIQSLRGNERESTRIGP